jgi:2-methylcitrate dehydratase PrpD
VSVSDFTEDAISDPEVLPVAAKVGYETPQYTTHPQAFPGGVRVRLTSGETLTADFPYQKGGPENPLSASEVSEKFRGNAELVLGSGAIDALEEAILDLEECANVSTALAPLALAESAHV